MLSPPWFKLDTDRRGVSKQQDGCYQAGVVGCAGRYEQQANSKTKDIY